jgi:hypothetical protein
MNEECRVHPKEPAVPTLQDIKVDVEAKPTFRDFFGYLGSCGCAGLVFSSVLISAIDFVADPSNVQEIAILLVVGVAVLAASVFVYRYDKARAPQVYKEKVEQALAELKAKRIENSLSEARRLTSRALNIVASHQDNLSTLPRLLSHVDRYLEKASTEYQEGAYAPFWDNVEIVAEGLSKFNNSLSVMGKLALDYNELLAGETHNFPALESKEIPDSRDTLDRFAKLVRQGQTNFEFAVIWEHRRVREGRVEGFSTLAELVDNVELTINQSLRDLERGVSSRRA